MAKAKAATPASATKATPKRFTASVPYSYDHKGETKTGWSSVGIAFESRDGEGVNIELRPGLAVMGRIILRPWQDKDTHTASEGQALGERRFRYNPDQPADELV